METVLNSLNTVPGVVGSMVCDAEGRVLARAFPAPFEASALQEAASALVDGTVGLEAATGSIGLVDLRFGDARLVAKPMARGLVALVCAKTVNLQLLVMSVSVASKKLEKLVAAQEVAKAVPAQAPPVLAPKQEAEGMRADSMDEFPERPNDAKKPKKKSNWFPSV